MSKQTENDKKFNGFLNFVACIFYIAYASGSSVSEVTRGLNSMFVIHEVSRRQTNLSLWDIAQKSSHEGVITRNVLEQKYPSFAIEIWFCRFRWSWMLRCEKSLHESCSQLRSLVEQKNLFMTTIASGNIKRFESFFTALFFLVLSRIVFGMQLFTAEFMTPIDVCDSRAINDACSLKLLQPQVHRSCYERCLLSPTNCRLFSRTWKVHSIKLTTANKSILLSRLPLILFLHFQPTKPRKWTTKSSAQEQIVGRSCLTAHVVESFVISN